MASQVAQMVKNPPANISQGEIRDPSLIPGLGRSPGGGHGDSLDRGAFLATVHGVTKSWTQLSNCHFFHMILIYIKV